jgi:hypothetical protein
MGFDQSKLGFNVLRKLYFNMNVTFLRLDLEPRMNGNGLFASFRSKQPCDITERRSKGRVLVEWML